MIDANGLQTEQVPSDSKKVIQITGGMSYSWFIYEDYSIKKFDHEKLTFENLNEKAISIATSPQEASDLNGEKNTVFIISNTR